MNEQNFDIDVDKVVKHWIETSDDDFETMLSLFKSESYGWCLFLGHITIEKLLKAYYVRKIMLMRHSPIIYTV